MKRLNLLALGAGLLAVLGACSGQDKPVVPVPPIPGQPAQALPHRGGAASPIMKPQAAMPVDPNSLYARLGQRPGIEAVATDFTNRMAKDRRVNKRFANTNAQVFIAKLTDQICQASGGPCTYAGKDMKAAHAGMGITEADWVVLLEHSTAMLNHLQVPAREQEEILGFFATLKDDIVENA